MVRCLPGMAVTILLLVAQGPRARADDQPARLCPDAADTMAEDPLLRRAAKAAYPGLPDDPAGAVGASRGPCVFPYQAVPFARAVVLIVLGQTPGEACHGCSAKMSAVLLKRDRNRLTVVARQQDFGESGTWGDPGTISPVRWGSDDGFLVEGAGTFQGETTSVLQAFVVRDGAIHALLPADGIMLSRSTCEGEDPGAHCQDIAGTWKVDPSGRMTIAYQGKREDGTPVRTAVVYERRGDALVRTSGILPF